MALCVLAADWKISGLESSGKESGLIDGLLAIIVDHGLRAESGEEANMVRERVSEMGMFDHLIIFVFHANCIRHAVFVLSISMF